MDVLSRHYHQLAGLNSDWAMSHVQLDVQRQTLTLSLEFVDNRVVCSECRAECSMKDQAAERGWRHLDAIQFQTTLTARVPRCSCDRCGVKTISVPWAEKHSRFTLLFEAFAIDVLHAVQSIQAAALMLRIDWSTAQVIMSRAVERGLDRRGLDDVRHVGIDEQSFDEGQGDVSVMTDIDQSRVLEVKPDRTTEAADQLWKTLSDEQRGEVEAVFMEMWQAYEASTEHRELQQGGDDRLKGGRQILLFSPENLREEKNEELVALRKSTLATVGAWSLKELFLPFLQETDAVGVRAFFESWCGWAIRCRLDPVKKVASILKNRLERILTWFASSISNRAAEGYNSRIRSIKSAARGLRLFEHYGIRLLSHCGGLSLYPH